MFRERTKSQQICTVFFSQKKKKKEKIPIVVSVTPFSNLSAAVESFQQFIPVLASLSSDHVQSRLSLSSSYSRVFIHKSNLVSV